MSKFYLQCMLFWCVASPRILKLRNFRVHFWFYTNPVTSTTEFILPASLSFASAAPEKYNTTQHNTAQHNTYIQHFPSKNQKIQFNFEIGHFQINLWYNNFAKQMLQKSFAQIGLLVE